MPSNTLAYTWEEVVREGREYCLEFNISVDWSPIIPAKIYGLPENCHPAEGGDIEVTEIDLQLVEEVFELCSVTRGADGYRRRYWEARFRNEVQKTDAFRDWLWGEIAEIEAYAHEPDDRRDELRDRYL